MMAVNLALIVQKKRIRYKSKTVGGRELNNVTGTTHHILEMIFSLLLNCCEIQFSYLQLLLHLTG